jgi:hypothetical protein
MRHEGAAARHSLWAAVVTAGLLAAGPTGAQSMFRGVAEVQYENVNHLVSAEDRESWQKALQIDFSTRIRRMFEFSSQLQWSELTFTGRPDRTSTPRGMVRLAHPLFGFSASYRPVTITDERDLTTKQQELMLSGYFQKARLPRVVGSWIRRHVDPQLNFPGSASVTRNVSANYDLGRLNFHAGWGDQASEATQGLSSESLTDHYSVGSSALFAWRRANGSVQYDYLQSRRKNGGAISDVSRLHMAGLNATYQVSPRTSSSLAYNFRHTGSPRPGTRPFTENDGSLGIAHQLTKALQLSGSGGVRTAAVGERKETESFVVGSVSADAAARPGWRVGAGASHSVNWLPSDRGRPVESFHSNTSMQLAKGLDVSGDLSISSSNRPVSVTDPTAATTQATLATGAGVRATPLRAITLNASTRHYRTSSSVWRGGPSINTNSVDAFLRPSDLLQVSGGWAQSSTPGTGDPPRTTERANLQWNPTSLIEASGTYTRASQGVRDPNTTLAGSRESYGARVLVALTRDLRTMIQYSEADPGRPSHARQVDVTVTQSFGR